MLAAGTTAIYSHYLSLYVYSIGRLKSKEDQEWPREFGQTTFWKKTERERE